MDDRASSQESVTNGSGRKLKRKIEMQDEESTNRKTDENHHHPRKRGRNNSEVHGVLPPKPIEGQCARNEHQSLPFTKNAVLWTTIESMEVFQKMPQNPHFRPLRICKEIFREGLAIGLMVNFANVVEIVSRLQVNDSKERILEILGTIFELENHGFDVKLLKDQVISLLEEKKLLEYFEIATQLILSIIKWRD